jgi:hypothetical protein
MTSPRSRKPIRLRVEPSFRVFLYLGFLGCTVATIVTLGWGGSWWAPMFGKVAFGIPAVIAYLTQEERQQNLQVWRLNNKAQSDSGGWDLEDDDTDPTVPPTPRERNR